MADVHSSSAPAVAKRMWSYLRAVFLMARKGLLSHKRRLLVTMHLLAKRNKALARTVAELLHSSQHHSQYSHGAALRRRDYEFSFTNSPADDPDSSSSGSRRLAYFRPTSCLGDDYAASPAPPPQIEHCYYYYAAGADSSSPGILLPAGEDDDEDQCCAGAGGASPDLLSSAAAGRFSVRVSNYSSEDEGANDAAGGEAVVDHDAEEFIRRFYDQLRRQNAIAMLPYMHELSSAA